MSDEGGDPACWAHVAGDGSTPRALTATETGELLNSDRVAHLGTVDADGFPHVTPIWFLWDGDALVMSCLRHRPQVARLRGNPRASLTVDAEDAERDDGQRPNRQVRARGTVELIDDVDGDVTRRISEKYLHGPGAAAQADRRSTSSRVVLRLVPDRWVAVAST